MPTFGERLQRLIILITSRNDIVLAIFLVSIIFMMILPLPTWLVRDIALKELGKHRQDRNFLRFNRSVKSLFCDDDGNLHIVYRPGELRTVFLGF